MPTPTAPVITDEYKNFLDLLAIYTEASNRLEQLQAAAQESFIVLVDEHRGDYAEMQAKLTEIEPAVEAIARAHPEWFTGKSKSIKTPYGTVSFRSSTKLDVPNEDATVLLIEKHCSEEEQELFIRKSSTLNLQALGDLSDARLKSLRIERVPDENFSIKPARVDLGKAVAAKKGDA